MHNLDELLKAVNGYEQEIGCSLICHTDDAEWSDYIRQIKWKCQQIGLSSTHAMSGVYSHLAVLNYASADHGK